MLHWSPRDQSLTPLEAAGTAAGLRLEITRDLAAVRPLWEAFAPFAVMTPFQSWSWLAAWCASSARSSPVIVLGYERGELKLIMPLAIERRLGASTLTWLAQDASDYNAPLMTPDLLARLKPADAGAILLAVARTLRRVDGLRLEKQPERLGERANPFALYSAEPFSCSAHAVHLSGSWEAFHDQRRSRKSQRRLKEKQKSLAKLGPLTFEGVTGPAERQAVVAQLVAWKSAQLEARGSRNPFRDGTLADFLSIAAATDPDHRIRIDALKVGGELAAGIFGLVHGAQFIYYIAAYDWDRFARYSPGAILLSRLIQDLHGRGFRVFDFSNGDEAYKDDWCDSSMGLSVTFVPLTLIGRMATILDRAWLRFVREVKARERLFEALRSLVSRWRDFRGLPKAQAL